MRFFSLFLFLSIGNMMFAQFADNFKSNSSDVQWFGTDSAFVRNEKEGLRLKASPESSESYLSAESEAIEETEWFLNLRIRLNPSGSNYVRFYLCSDSRNLADSLNGYFLLIGNAKDQIALYRQKGKTKTKIGESEEDLLNMDSVRLEVKVRRDMEGEWVVAAKLNDETGFAELFSCRDSVFSYSNYAGFYCKYSKTKSDGFYFFDSVSVVQKEIADYTPPKITRFSFASDSLLFTFSEAVDLNSLKYEFPFEIEFEQKSKNEVAGFFSEPLRSGEVHKLNVLEVSDLKGNVLNDTSFVIALVESVELGDVLLSEILFNPYPDGCDFVEIYNNSDKVVNLASLKISTRRSNGNLYAQKPLPEKLLLPKEYVVICSSVEQICNYYDCAERDRFAVIEKLPSYGNESGVVVLLDQKENVIDEFSYTASMHSDFVKDVDGVSLERSSFDKGEWVSASQESGYATPGRANSANAEETSSANSVELINDVANPSQGKFAVLRYFFADAGYSANVQVFSANGKLVRVLRKKELLSAEGIIEWDGTDSCGRALPVAPYIIRFEAINEKGGYVRESLVCVVSE